MEERKTKLSPKYNTKVKTDKVSPKYSLAGVANISSSLKATERNRGNSKEPTITKTRPCFLYLLLKNRGVPAE